MKRVPLRRTGKIKKKATSLGWTKKALPSVANQQQAPRTRIRPKKRTAKEFARVYGSEERQRFVASLPCVGCGYKGSIPRHNHHTENGGLSRKADFDTIVPLCFLCHVEVHWVGRETFERRLDIDLKDAAIATHSRWIEESKKR